MAEIFAYDKPIVSDRTTYPDVSSNELRNCMAIVYNHLKDHRTVSQTVLDTALDTMAKVANNENWVVYVP